MRWVAVLPLFALACNQPSETATATALSEADKTAIDSVFARISAAIRAADWDTFTGEFAEDAVFHPANSPGLFGREDIRAWASSGPKATSAFNFSNVEIIGAGNLAYATSDIAMNFEGVPADQAKQLVVLRKEPNGEWKTVAVSFNSNTPMPAPTTTGQ
jgi:ketosteroid isomerase-like protein